MTESFAKPDNNQKSVVLLEYPRKGVWAVGFATKENEGMIKNKIKEEIINVFVPTTPESYKWIFIDGAKKRFNLS